MSPVNGAGAASQVAAALERLRADPASTAVLTDVDGTLAPIVERPENVAIEPRAAILLRRLAKAYGTVGCISGRPAREVKRLIEMDELAYAGNHGLELLPPRTGDPQFAPALAGHEADAMRFVAQLGGETLVAADLRLEDKGPIQALHWRGAEDEEAAEARAREIAADAAGAGLLTHWGRKVLELRPNVRFGKDAAIDALLAGTGASAAIYAGDDRTDLDAFRRLREIRESGGLETTVCVGVVSAEGPEELAKQSDLTVDGPDGWLDLLDGLLPDGPIGNAG